MVGISTSMQLLKYRKEADMEEMTKEEFKTIMEMVTMIIEGSKDKEEALEKIKSLTILRDSQTK